MPFVHRVQRNGTVDSICDQCFITVGTTAAESELQLLENAHICEPARIAYYHHVDLAIKRPPVSDPFRRPASQVKVANKHS